jgi:hypothetical protein
LSSPNAGAGEQQDGAGGEGANGGEVGGGGNWFGRRKERREEAGWPVLIGGDSLVSPSTRRVVSLSLERILEK